MNIRHNNMFTIYFIRRDHYNSVFFSNKLTLLRSEEIADSMIKKMFIIFILTGNDFYGCRIVILIR